METGERRLISRQGWVRERTGTFKGVPWKSEASLLQLLVVTCFASTLGFNFERGTCVQQVESPSPPLHKGFVAIGHTCLFSPALSLGSLGSQWWGNETGKERNGEKQGLCGQGPLCWSRCGFGLRWESRGCGSPLPRRGPGNKSTRSGTPTLTPHCIWTPYELQFHWNCHGKQRTWLIFHQISHVFVCPPEKTPLSMLTLPSSQVLGSWILPVWARGQAEPVAS